jgi:hypothetical protein
MNRWDVHIGDDNLVSKDNFSKGKKRRYIIYEKNRKNELALIKGYGHQRYKYFPVFKNGKPVLTKNGKQLIIRRPRRLRLKHSKLRFVSPFLETYGFDKKTRRRRRIRESDLDHTVIETIDKRDRKSISNFINGIKGNTARKSHFYK